MGTLESVKKLFGKTVYLDTNIFIYAVEQSGNVGYLAEFIKGLFTSSDRGEIQAITSELTLAETMVGAYAKFPKLVIVYEELIQESNFLHVFPVDRDSLKQSAQLRSLHKIALADAMVYPGVI